MKILTPILFCCILLTTKTNAQYQKLSIQKNGKEKFAYKLTQNISLIINHKTLHKGRLDYITDDTIYLNVFDKIAIKDITSIEPFFVQTVSINKMNLSEVLMSTFISAIIITVPSTMNPFAILDLPSLFFNLNQQDEKLNRKEKRMQRKRFEMKDYNLNVTR